MLECVVNLSEGRRPEVLARLAAACGPALLDTHADPDHHRSVLTIGAVDRSAVEDSVRRLATAAAAELTLADHSGVHPRLGVVDVVPFVALPPTPPAAAVEAAQQFARWLADTLAVPAFLYDAADPGHRSLPSVRRDAFGGRRPDTGPDHPHPRLGACAVGARPPLVAVNVELDRDDLELACAVAHEVRERDGGLAGVRALGLRLASRGATQVSMNLVDLDATGLEQACTAVRDRLASRGAGVARVELVGLLPASALAACSAPFRTWAGISADATLEARVDRADGVATAATRDEGREPRA